MAFWVRWLFAVWGAPVHCRVFRRIPGFYSLDASSYYHLCPPLWQWRMSSENAKCPLRGKISPSWEPWLIRSFVSPFLPFFPATCLTMCKSFLNVFPFLQRQSGHWRVPQLSDVHCPFPSLLKELQDLIFTTAITRLSFSIFELNQAVRLCYVEAAVANFSKQEQPKMPSDFPNKEVLFDRLDSIK